MQFADYVRQFSMWLRPYTPHAAAFFFNYSRVNPRFFLYLYGWFFLSFRLQFALLAQFFMWLRPYTPFPFAQKKRSLCADSYLVVLYS